MRHVFRTIPLLALLWSGCESPTANETQLSTGALGFSRGVEHAATGGGHYSLQNTFDTKFAFSAIAHGDGTVSGNFHQKLELEGESVDFRGRVTCLAFDPANDRAWVGGVIVANNSTHPSFQQSFHEPGHDVWFRVVDYGEGAAAAPDRTTFLGFENTPGIPTSEFYCNLQPWPDDDARTWPVTNGNIQVR